MNNQIEVIRLEDGVVSFNHQTGVMSAKWDNGYDETWSNHYGLDAHRNAFYLFTNQLERIKHD